MGGWVGVRRVWSGSSEASSGCFGDVYHLLIVLVRDYFGHNWTRDAEVPRHYIEFIQRGCTSLCGYSYLDIR